MKLEDKGIPQDAVITEIKDILEQDQLYEHGHILGSMCTYPHEFASKLASMFPEKNLGDPGLFLGTARLEVETIQMLGDMLGEEAVVGNIVTGGSEANIVAMNVAKKYKPIKKDAEVLVPESAHASFYKAADFMGFKLKVLKLDKETYQIDLGEFERALTEKTIGVVGIAGTTSLGLVDPIAEMGKIIEEKDPDIYFHIDAAFGGFVLPFLEEMGHEIPPFDFSVPAIKSMTCDPHKMGMNLIPSGGYMLREKYYKSSLGFDIPYLAGGSFKHFNLMGTRPGSVVIACWGLMRYLGRDGFKAAVKECWENTKYFVKRIQELDRYVALAHEPLINVVGMRSITDVPMKDIDTALREAGWYLGYFGSMDPPLERVVLMPHIKRNAIDDFIVDLEKILKELND